MRHRDMRSPTAFPVHRLGRMWFRHGKQRMTGRPSIKTKSAGKTAGERMTFLACLRMADAEQPGRGLTYVL